MAEQKKGGIIKKKYERNIHKNETSYINITKDFFIYDKTKKGVQY